MGGSGDVCHFMDAEAQEGQVTRPNSGLTVRRYTVTNRFPRFATGTVKPLSMVLT